MDEQYCSDIPEVQEEIRVLHEQLRNITRLEAELDQLRKDHADQKQKLSPYRIETPAKNLTPVKHIVIDTTESVPIHRFSDDELYLIFENYLYGEFDNHPSIRYLLLVCRRWYVLLMNSPNLWSCVVIKKPLELFDIANKKSNLSYVQACMSRSKNLPLDMQIYMTVLSPGSYISESLHQFGKTITDEDQHDSLQEQIDAEEWEFSSSHFQAQLGRVLECLIGPEGEHAKRYRSLFLTFPMDTDLGAFIWMKMVPHFQQLRWLSVSGFPDDWTERQYPSQPILPSVKQLFSWTSSDDTAVPISLLKVSPITLVDLSMTTDWSLSNLEELSSFTQLIQLTIYCKKYQGENDGGDTNGPPTLSISLPYLHSLSLGEHYGRMRRLNLICPSLDSLHIEADKKASKLPKLSPRHIQCRAVNKEKNPFLKMEAVVYIILLSDKLESITVQESFSNVAMFAVASCKTKGNASLLTELIVELEAGASLTLDV